MSDGRVAWQDDSVTVYAGDCLDVLRDLPDASVDSVCTDPPYEISFMGRSWDSAGVAFGTDVWRQCLRVLKPGGHLLAFGGTRTYHRLTCAIEDAGFEVRDCIMWIYGSGFPKSLDVSKAIDKAAGAERDVVGAGRSGGGRTAMNDAPGNGRARGYLAGDFDRTAPSTDDAKRWDGWGTALKPAHEPIVVARKPLAGTVAQNLVAHGTGALNIGATRVPHASEADRAESEGKNRHADFGTEPGGNEVYGDFSMVDRKNYDGSGGRWPTNLVFSHSPDCREVCAEDCPVAELDRQSGDRPGMGARVLRRGVRSGSSMGLYNDDARPQDMLAGYDDVGGASRFFPVFRYEPKADASERPRVNGVAHPTVKPLGLMRWLVRLVAPKGAVVLDPFTGSGTTAEACVIEGFRCIVIEREPTYLPLIKARLTKPLQPALEAA